MKLELRIASKPLEVELDDVIAALLALRLDLPDDANLGDALARYLSEKGAPWVLDDDHMRKRIFRRLILDIADPALIIRHLMTGQ